MNSRECFGIGASLLGVYAVIQGVATLPQVTIAYEMTSTEDARASALVSLAVVAQSALLIAIGSILVYRYRTTISSAALSPLSTQAALSVGLCLLGVYLSISGIVEMVASISQALIMTSRWQLLFAQIASDVLHAVAGLVLSLRASLVAAYLLPATSTDPPS